MKDAGETGAGAATTGREGGDSSECDRLVRFLGPQGAVMCHSIGPSDGLVGRRETAGTQAPGVLRQRVPVHGARVNIMALVAEK